MYLDFKNKSDAEILAGIIDDLGKDVKPEKIIKHVLKYILNKNNMEGIEGNKIKIEYNKDTNE